MEHQRERHPKRRWSLVPVLTVASLAAAVPVSAQDATSDTFQPLHITAIRVEAAGAEAPFASALTQFRSERTTLLRDPEATLLGYRELVTRHAARIDPASLSLEELAQGTFE